MLSVVCGSCCAQSMNMMSAYRADRASICRPTGGSKMRGNRMKLLKVTLLCILACVLTVASWAQSNRTVPDEAGFALPADISDYRDTCIPPLRWRELAEGRHCWIGSILRGEFP